MHCQDSTQLTQRRRSRTMIWTLFMHVRHTTCIHNLHNWTERRIQDKYTIIDGYSKDKRWSKVIEKIQRTESASDSMKTNLPYWYIEELLYSKQAYDDDLWLFGVSQTRWLPRSSALCMMKKATKDRNALGIKWMASLSIKAGSWSQRDLSQTVKNAFEIKSSITSRPSMGRYYYNL